MQATSMRIARNAAATRATSMRIAKDAAATRATSMRITKNAAATRATSTNITNFIISEERSLFMAKMTFDTPLGTLLLITEDHSITDLRFVEENGEAYESPDALCQTACKQLIEYFEGKRREFDLPLRPAGTPFQKAVWKAVARVPYGQTRSYQDISNLLGKPTASRAVGAAIGRNPIWLLIPCHRIIGSNGSLTGYAGGLWRKERLLALEGIL